MDAFRAPGAANGAPEVDLASARPGVLPQLCGAVLVVSGLFSGATALQTFVFATFYTWFVLMPLLQGVLAVVGMGLGGMMTRANLIAAVSAVPVALLAALLGWVWVLYALYGGAFSVLALVAALVATLAAVVVPAALPSVIATHRARQALYA